MYACMRILEMYLDPRNDYKRIQNQEFQTTTGLGDPARES